MSKTPIKTVGELRDTLATAINDVRDGSLDLDNARTMVKLAAQINESFYSELKARQMATDASEQACALGQMPIN